ncbi:MAG TPA: hypothetical protein ENJ82_13215 [Bacteroidetes bacterium]|nr:hypothetical protein [Bacteroidota bacterium]
MKALEIYGYDRTKGALKSNHIRIPLENLNGGLTMVALIKVELDKNVLRDNHKIEASLRYFDVHTQQSAQVAAHKKAGNLNGTSASVKKNFTIAEMAQGLQKMAQHYQKKEVKAAALAIDNALFKAENRFPDLNDEDIRRVYDILKKYQKDIKVLAQNNSEIQE